MPGFELRGQPIAVEFRPHLRAHRGKLLSGGERGAEVHAAGFLRERRIVLDAALARNPRERDRILLHEVAHFIWWKLGPPTRAAYESLVAAELDQGAPGEFGWSAELRKLRLTPRDRRMRTREYREYLCESFCDTAAAYALALKRHPELTLDRPSRRRRLAWMEEFVRQGRLKV